MNTASSQDTRPVTIYGTYHPVAGTTFDPDAYRRTCEVLEDVARAVGERWLHNVALERVGLNVLGLWLLSGSTLWNPLACSATALNMAVDAGQTVHIDRERGFTEVQSDSGTHRTIEFHYDDAQAATRLAIARAIIAKHQGLASD